MFLFPMQPRRTSEMMIATTTLLLYSYCYHATIARSSVVEAFQLMIVPAAQQQQRDHNHIPISSKSIYTRTAKTITISTTTHHATKGFGGTSRTSSIGNGSKSGGSESKKKNTTTKNTTSKNRLMDALEDKPKSVVATTNDDGNVAKPYVKAEQDKLLDET
jgi:hypothetical protein